MTGERAVGEGVGGELRLTFTFLLVSFAFHFCTFLGGIQIQYLTDTQPVAAARKSLFVALACYY